MTRERKPPAAQSGARVDPVADPVAASFAGPPADPLRRLAAFALLSPLQWFMTLIAAMILGFSGVLLAEAWLIGPQVAMRHAQYERYTASAPALMTEAWLAVDLDPRRIRSADAWRAIARAVPCGMVEVQGDRTAPRRRGVCGVATNFKEGYDLAGLRKLAPGVPFVWPRDARGFAVPQVRLSPTLLQWLSTHPANRFMHSDWPATSQLDWLRLSLDQPVDAAVAGWRPAPPALRVAYDPAHADDWLPAGAVTIRMAQHASWLAMALLGAGGLALWLLGMRLLPAMGAFDGVAKVIMIVLPLLALPWWAEYFPRGLRAFNAPVAEIVSDMFADLDPLDRLVVGDPADALLASGAKLVWRLDDSHYADTLGALPLAPPASPPASDDAAFELLVREVGRGVAALDETARAAFFDRLQRDKRIDLTAAGEVALPAARAAAVSASESPSRRAARAFLAQWAVSPKAAADPHRAAYKARAAVLADDPAPR